MNQSLQKYVLLIHARDELGLIYKITSILYQASLNIEKNSEYVDKEEGLFFFRAECSLQGLNQQIPEIKQQLLNILPQGSMIFLEECKRKDIIILCTKENHCLGDLLLRYESGEMECNIKAIISNHRYLQKLAERFEIPFYAVLSDGLSREQHETKLLQQLDELGGADYLVLAKYMRILSEEFVVHYKNKMINIHHSFLPAFVGANPYKQAYHRGVKIIGATAHFVNENLDEGPIIAQDVVKIDHTYSVREIQKAGRDVEKIVLARALMLALNYRIFIYNNKTVIF
ncbi:formyltetrahydrofolate deformylase [Helicobacter monodelphidis]|uniref:formyltetrahydrofolate deformylase n=1 Tax=Helicobacter sp. 15-1451 TaxID=2004995 RepID=UPI000DCBE21C|nr:formyltetrahydrofolate deformylase [Helicobacter sp. 15-1451]RAX59205.1 formyltetrahydrofolate deformylase [Helicobacter sp. 15-1451]